MKTIVGISTFLFFLNSAFAIDPKDLFCSPNVVPSMFDQVSTSTRVNRDGVLETDFARSQGNGGTYRTIRPTVLTETAEDYVLSGPTERGEEMRISVSKTPTGQRPFTYYPAEYFIQTPEGNVVKEESLYCFDH